MRLHCGNQRLNDGELLEIKVSLLCLNVLLGLVAVGIHRPDAIVVVFRRPDGAIADIRKPILRRRVVCGYHVNYISAGITPVVTHRLKRNKLCL
ncbi:hypothetical protein Bca52824_065344 [Brassica carinata]|uniref:Uncharacterized protein n=1 Tax=Brassica carinata TaxID=52824 RepID=A0A8X7QNW9_BRACI|nr:hypothetical protein Bca52824_065344 [Brassica carinata]